MNTTTTPTYPERRHRGNQLARVYLNDCHTADTASIVTHLLGKVDNLDDALDLIAALAPAWLARITGSSVIRQNDRAVISPNIKKANPPRLAEAAARYRALLSIRETAADGSKKWLRDMTADDLRHAAQIRFDHAQANEAAGKRYEHLAALLDKVGCPTVAGLPGDCLVEVFG